MTNILSEASAKDRMRMRIWHMPGHQHDISTWSVPTRTWAFLVLVDSIGLPMIKRDITRFLTYVRNGWGLGYECASAYAWADKPARNSFEPDHDANFSWELGEAVELCVQSHNEAEIAVIVLVVMGVIVVHANK